MRKISRASDSIWHTSAGLSEDAEYAENKARSDAHRADAAKLSDRDLQEGHDNLAEDIELDSHNHYDLIGRLLNGVGHLPEMTPAEKAHNDLMSRHIEFGKELDSRGLWGPAAELRRQKMIKRIEDYPKVRAYQDGLVARGDLTTDHDAYYGDDWDKYMAHGGFTLAEAKSVGAKFKEEESRRNQRKLMKLFGQDGFDPSNPEHHAVRDQLLREHDEKG